MTLLNYVFHYAGIEMILHGWEQMRCTFLGRRRPCQKRNTDESWAE